MWTEMIVPVILLAIIIAVLLLIHFFVIGKTFRRIGNNGVGGEQMVLQIGSGSNHGSNTELSRELKNFPCFDYKAAETEGGAFSPEDCVVCLDNFNVGDACRLFPNCNHSFHAQCIESWVLKTPACPICRTGIYPLKIGPTTSEGSGASVGVVGQSQQT